MSDTTDDRTAASGSTGPQWPAEDGSGYALPRQRRRRGGRVLLVVLLALVLLAGVAAAVVLLQT